MEFNLELLRKVTQVAGAPGYEDPIREVITAEIKPYVDEISVDNIGNLIAVKRSENPDAPIVVVDAHMDEIAFMVNNIDDKGFIQVLPLGGFDAKTLTAQRVIVHGRKDIVGVFGAKAIHVMTDEERKKPADLNDYFIDLGLSKDEVVKYVSIGDVVTRERDVLELGDCVCTKSLDNRIAVYILIEALKKIQRAPVHIYALFSVQEEVGLRGATVAAHSINPHFAICLDVTLANDMPGIAANKKITELGKGAAIKIMDGRTICDHRMVDFLKSTAERESIAWQPEVMNAGGTNTSPLQLFANKGAIAGAISIPLRYMHQVTETAHKGDVNNCIDLLVAAIETLDKHHWAR
jgi:tetrahedral aminopeptidase